jgi:hypothetical protein
VGNKVTGVNMEGEALLEEVGQDSELVPCGVVQPVRCLLFVVACSLVGSTVCLLLISEEI